MIPILKCAVNILFLFQTMADKFYEYIYISLHNDNILQDVSIRMLSTKYHRNNKDILQ